MHKEYSHPAPYSPDHDYREMKDKAEKHIKDITKQGVHFGQAQHLGGMASYSDHLQKMQYGQAHAVKGELKRVIDYLYYYSMTKHDIYHFMAEDALMHVEQLVNDIEDAEDRQNALYFLECTKEYMSWLKTEKSDKKHEAPHSGNPVNF